MAVAPNYNQYSSSKIYVENIPTFRRIQDQRTIHSFPETPLYRKLTDVPFLIILAICIVVQVCLMIYAFVNSDIQRLVKGYDNCGNVCGIDNSFIEGIPCSGQDMRNKKFLQIGGNYQTTNRICVKECTYYTHHTSSRCYLNGQGPGFFENTATTLSDQGVNLTVLCFVGLGLSILALVCFRYYLKQFVWTMLIACILGMFAICGACWYLDSQGGTQLLGLSIVLTISAVIFALCILFLASRINLIIHFFELACEAVFAMPLLLLEPVLTFVAEFVIVALFVYFGLLMVSSGTLQQSYEYGVYEYTPNVATTIAAYFSIIVMLWMLQFVLCCQQMVISGSVSAYYFTVDKLTLVSPIYNSFYNLIRFHLGSAAFGSFLITLVRIIVLFMKSMNTNRYSRLFYICLRPLERYLRYLTSIGYIEIAIHGQPLCRSCMRGFTIIIYNLLSAIAMNNIGSLVFFMVKLLVVMITVGVGFILNADALVIVLGGLVAFLCVHCFFVVFETAVDTIFICYCEDQCINDGNAQKPYYASVALHNHIKEAQIIGIALENKKK